MPSQTLSASAAQRFYDSIGRRYDWFESFESQAKQRAKGHHHCVKGEMAAHDDEEDQQQTSATKGNQNRPGLSTDPYS